MEDLKIHAKDRNELESMTNRAKMSCGNIGLQFELDKCVILLIKNRNIESGSEDMITQNGGGITAVREV